MNDQRQKAREIAPDIADGVFLLLRIHFGNSPSFTSPNGVSAEEKNHYSRDHFVEISSFNKDKMKIRVAM